MQVIKKLFSKIDKKKLYDKKKKLSLIATWQLAILFIIFTAMSVWFLRQNNLKMVQLRGEVISSDLAGAGVEESLTKLGNFVISHMNTTMAGPIQLPNSFNRDYEELVAESESITNAQYLNIREKCVTFDVPVEAQSECIRNETALISSEEFSLPLELYSFNFKSPFWSPDLAGVFSLISLLLFTAIIVKSSAQYLVKQILKQHR